MIAVGVGPGFAAEDASATPFKTTIAPFFQSYCVKCHGPEKSKGDLAVHTLESDLLLGQDLDKWESILEMLQFGEMPPIDEPQPKPAEVKAVRQWIESGLRAYVKQASQKAPEPKTRRLTNVEYQNTLNALLDIEFDIMGDLPEDPKTPYHFNNTAELMRIGPEQWERYLHIARKAMQSAIVDPEPPQTVKARGQWNQPRNGLNEAVGVGGLKSPARGFNLQGPYRGMYRIRMSASALPLPGRDGVWVEINMGHSLNGDHIDKPYATVANVYLTNAPGESKVYEFTGRLESVPFSMEKTKDGTESPARRVWPNLPFDDGTFNDGHRPPDLHTRATVDWIEVEAPVFDTWPPKHHTKILFDSPLRETDETAYVRAVLERFMSRAYRRPASEPEVERFVKIYQLARPGADTFEAAMRETLALVLVAPRFLYHTESEPETDEQFALASRLSYFLWASMPDQELFDLAAQKKLNDRVVIEQQVLRLLADKRSDGFIKDFTLQWLSLEKMLTVPINRDLYPRFLHLVNVGETKGLEVPYRTTVRDYMLQETLGFVGHLIRENKSVLNVVDSDFAILNERLAAHYGVEGVEGIQLRPVPIKPKHHLGGLLTQGSVLIGNGTGTAPHPIYRAVWLREAILGDEVPPPPSEVPALSDSAGDSLEKAHSIVDLLAKHRTVESCNDCHFRLDPWGIPFEEYNAIGKYQFMVPKDGTRVAGFDAKKGMDPASYQKYLDSINTVKVDAKARLPHGPEVNGMQELKAYLLAERKDDIARNVIQRLLTYGIGRHLTYRDRFAVDELFEQAQANGLGMRDIIVSICKSDVFRDTPSRREE